jgi:glutamate-1-semialdehyde 2,1-aminomutase
VSALVGGASTQSRARRPLPPGAIAAVTEGSAGVREMVRFTTPDGQYRRECLSWVVGQWGGLWGSPGGPYEGRPQLPLEILRALECARETPGSYGHAAEHALADTLAEIYAPYIAGGDIGVRLALNGSDACNMAARLARAHTGRDAIYGIGYHGHGDSFAHEPATRGVPGLLVGLHRYYPEMLPDHILVPTWPAAVIVEVPAWDDDAAIVACLRHYRAECDRTGALLVVDEVVTGARLGIAGACQRYGITADLVVLGKAISATGGVSAVVGRRDVVELLADQVFYSGTFFGMPGPCLVANATLRWLMAHPEAYEHIGLIGSELKCGLNNLGIQTVGQNERSVLKFETDAAWLGFCGEMIARGVIVHRPQFPTLSHTLADVRETLEVAAEVCASRAA